MNEERMRLRMHAYIANVQSMAAEIDWCEKKGNKNAEQIILLVVKRDAKRKN